MPTYEYECTACGHQMEAFHGMTEKPLRTCPECRKPKLNRLIGRGAGIIFKGSGFYETDYKRAGRSAAEASESKAPSDAPKESAKTDSTTPKKDSGGAKTET